MRPVCDICMATASSFNVEGWEVGFPGDKMLSVCDNCWLAASPDYRERFLNESSKRDS